MSDRPRPAPAPGGRVRAFHRTPGRTYPVVVRAEGVYLWDAGGKRYLDGASGALVANIGHGRADVAEVAARQLRQVDFVHGSQFSSEPFERLAERLSAWVPSGAWRFFAVAGGSEATESAIKLVRQVHVERGEPQRHVILSRSTSYHGASLGALAASGMGARKTLYGPLLNEASFVKFPPPRRALPGPEDAAAVEAAILAVGPDRAAAVFLEPVIGAAAPALVPNPGYYEAVRAICDRHGVLLVFDEVMCGMGRVGRPFAFENWGAVPDAIIIGKGLAAGYAPLAGVLAGEHLVATIEQGSGSFVHGFTYAGHPGTAAVGLAVLDALESEGLVAASARLGERLLGAFCELAAATPEISEVRGVGSLLGLVLDDPEIGAPFARAGYAYAVGRVAMDLGLVVYPGTGAHDGARGDHLLVGPPFSMADAEADELVEKLGHALAMARGQMGAFQEG